jgi:ATP-dependent helicase HrpA
MKALQEKKSDLLAYGLKFILLLNKILGVYKEILEAIKTPRKMPLSVSIKQDIETQLEYLIYPGFILHTPMKYLERYEIYLKAILIRLEKYQEIKDKELRAELNRVWDKYLSKPEIPLTAEIHYLIEELRVSLCAQNLKAEKGVSVKKLLETF